MHHTLIQKNLSPSTCGRNGLSPDSTERKSQTYCIIQRFAIHDLRRGAGDCEFKPNTCTATHVTHVTQRPEKHGAQGKVSQTVHQKTTVCSMTSVALNAPVAFRAADISMELQNCSGGTNWPSATAFPLTHGRLRTGAGFLVVWCLARCSRTRRANGKRETKTNPSFDRAQNPEEMATPERQTMRSAPRTRALKGAPQIHNQKRQTQRTRRSAQRQRKQPNYTGLGGKASRPPSVRACVRACCYLHLYSLRADKKREGHRTHHEGEASDHPPRRKMQMPAVNVPRLICSWLHENFGVTVPWADTSMAPRCTTQTWIFKWPFPDVPALRTRRPPTEPQNGKSGNYHFWDMRRDFRGASLGAT